MKLFIFIFILPFLDGCATRIYSRTGVKLADIQSDVIGFKYTDGITTVSIDKVDNSTPTRAAGDAASKNIMTAGGAGGAILTAIP